MSRLILTGMVVVASISCGATAAQQPPAASNLLVSTTELAAHLKDSDLVLLHVADPATVFEQAHIPGARFLSYGEVAVDGPDELGAELPPMDELKRVLADAGVSDDSRVVLYGNTVLAARAFFTLDVTGHRRVAVLDGGLPAWQAEGRPVATGPSPSPAAKGTFVPRVNQTRLAAAEWIRGHAAAIALVDVRPDAEYTGSDGGMGGVHAPGHIDGARQLTWNALMAPDGRFLPPAQLREKLSAAGAAPGKPVVVYCMVGMRASVMYLVARHLGLDAKLYDGSIVDWTLRKLPTKTGR
jgi:thiosulfate/3-mercaptopyruvate sulfurtransferase